VRCKPEVKALSNAFSIEVAEHTIAYEIIEAERLIRIIWIDCHSRERRHLWRLSGRCRRSQRQLRKSCWIGRDSAAGIEHHRIDTAHDLAHREQKHRQRLRRTIVTEHMRRLAGGAAE
jgi:hypothetical protein